MIDILIITTIVILIAISIWLYRSLKKVYSNLVINTSISNKPSMHSYLKPLIKEKPSLGKAFRTGSDAGPRLEPLPGMVRYNGFSLIPLKVYQGDSCTIALSLHPSIRKPVRNEKPIRIYRKDNKVNVTLTVSSKEKEYLEVEMMAAGFRIDGKKKQRQLLVSDALLYQWNCFFENSGSHSFAFVFKVVDSSNNAVQIGRVEQAIKVAQIDHLTRRQIWVMASSAGVISSILTLAEILRNLGIW